MLVSYNFTLEKMLMQDTKKMILENAEWLHIRLNKNEKKSVLAKRMADTILYEPISLLCRLPYEELLDLQKMVHAKDHAIPCRFSLNWNCITQIGLTDHIGSEDDQYQFIYPDLADALMPVIDKYIDSLVPEKGKVRYEKIILGLLNLYGILSFEKLAELCISFDPEFTPEKIKKIIDGSYLLCSRCTWEKGNNFWYTSPYLEKTNNFLNELNSRHLLHEVRFNLEEVLAASHANEPQPPLNDASRDAHRLLLTSFGTEEYVSWWITQCWILLNNDRNPHYLIQEVLSKHDLHTGQLNEFVSILMDWINRLPRWIMKGNSSHEVFHKYEKPRLMEKPPKMVLGPNARKAGISISQEKVNEIWKEHFQKPARNAPCPCGSGKKYKHCCGKK